MSTADTTAIKLTQDEAEYLLFAIRFTQMPHRLEIMRTLELGRDDFENLRGWVAWKIRGAKPTKPVELTKTEVRFLWHTVFHLCGGAISDAMKLSEEEFRTLRNGADLKVIRAHSPVPIGPPPA